VGDPIIDTGVAKFVAYVPITSRSLAHGISLIRVKQSANATGDNLIDPAYNNAKSTPIETDPP